ncbi:MAG TPA: DUF5719 family protein [Acidimicrobiia bacterium]|nr:DUF5719 family protein [Acidimicrobiia bacterium]
MKVFGLLVVAALAAATLVVPEPAAPVPHAPDPRAPAPYAVCPLGEAAGRTTAFPVVGGPAGQLDANVFSGGEVVATEAVTVEGSGTAVLELADVTGLARAPVLFGLDEPSRAIETIVTGDGMAASSCGPGSPDPQVVLGGTTTEGHAYTVVLTNPFAGSATVDVLAASEVGTESEPALEGIVVPPRSVVPVDLHSLLPGRQLISAAVITNQGQIAVGALHGSGEDISAMGGAGPSLDWYAPVPGLEGVSVTLVLYAPGTAEVPFQLDVYAPEDVFEAAHEDVIPARGQIAVPLADLLEGPGAIRVVSAGPVVAALRLERETGNAVVPGVPVPGPAWLLPGAGRLGAAQILVFNPGQVAVSARLLAGSGGEVETFDVPASTMVAVTLPERPVGARVEGDGDLVVTWVTAGEGGLAGDSAQPAG